jgi:hypothetical protein
MSEEKFDEDKKMSDSTDLSFLTRSATANAPSVFLSDSPPDRARVVTSVHLASPPNPSQEFTQNVVATLEAAWGERTGGNGSSEWQWVSDKFTAKLESGRSAEGQLLSLGIRARR